MDDSQALLQAIQKMDSEALARAFDLYAPAIYKYAYRHCNNAIVADQIVGDVFAKLLEHLSQGKGPSTNLRSYLFEIAYHALVDEVRHSQRMTSFEAMEFILPVTGSTDLTVEDHMLMEILRRAMQSVLTEDQRHVIFLRFLEDFSVKETARIMGKKAGNIKVIQNRAIAALRKALEGRSDQKKIVEPETLVLQSL